MSDPHSPAYFMVIPEAVARRTSVAAFREWFLEEARTESLEEASTVAVP